MVERQARDLELRGSNPGPGSNFSLELELNYLQSVNESLWTACTSTFPAIYTFLQLPGLLRSTSIFRMLNGLRSHEIYFSMEAGPSFAFHRTSWKLNTSNLVTMGRDVCFRHSLWISCYLWRRFTRVVAQRITTSTKLGLAVISRFSWQHPATLSQVALWLT